MKVKITQRVRIAGGRVEPGTIVELEGADLSTILTGGFGVPAEANATKEVPHTLETETQPSLVKSKKKLGPKKAK